MDARAFIIAPFFARDPTDSISQGGLAVFIGGLSARKDIRRNPPSRAATLPGRRVTPSDALCAPDV
jgi:hypothetical protein